MPRLLTPGRAKPRAPTSDTSSPVDAGHLCACLYLPPVRAGPLTAGHQLAERHSAHRTTWPSPWPPLSPAADAIGLHRPPGWPAQCSGRSMVPAVRIMPLPDVTSVDGPMTRSGWTPFMVSGFPAFPKATIRPSRMPTSALMTPQWSKMTAPVITRSGVPSARVAADWPIDSRTDLPPPNTASSPPPQRSSSISMKCWYPPVGCGPRWWDRTRPRTRRVES